MKTHQISVGGKNPAGPYGMVNVLETQECHIM